MYHEKSDKERRMFAKIRFYKDNKYSTLAEVYYFKNDMTIDFFHRWKWYFEYRAALLRVQNPHSFIELSTGSYEYILPEEEYRTKLQNLLTAAKRKRTEFYRKIEYVKTNWNELFPMEEHPKWNKVQQKLSYYEERVLLLENELSELNP